MLESRPDQALPSTGENRSVTRVTKAVEAVEGANPAESEPPAERTPRPAVEATQDDQLVALDALKTSAALSRASGSDEHWMEAIKARELAASNILEEREQAKIMEAARLQRVAVAAAAETARLAKEEQRRADIEMMRVKNQGNWREKLCTGHALAR